MGDNPMAWMIEINGFIVDARHLKREFRRRRCGRVDPVHPRTGRVATEE